MEVVDLSMLGRGSGLDAITKAKLAGNINIHNAAHTEVMELSKESRTEQEKHADALRKIEALSRGRMLNVPTVPSEVAAALRKLGQPIKLFGEGPADTRERLRNHLAQLALEGEEDALGTRAEAEAAAAAAAAQRLKAAPDDQIVYTTATEDLIAARRVIAAFSFAQASRRLAGAKRRRAATAGAAAGTEDPQLEAAAAVCACARRLVSNVSAVGDERPLSCVRVSPCGTLVASGAWSGLTKLWQLTTLRPRGTLTGHTERVTGLAWHPAAGLSAGPALLATAGADKTVRLWDTAAAVAATGAAKADVACAAVLKGHADRLARVEFHPCGRYVGTASYDHTWRLWDVETQTQLLLQDGHHKEVYAIAFQGDGSLVATGDFSGVLRLWDLRSGKSVYAAAAHVKKVTCCDFSPSGWELATGSDDHTVKVWDIRKRACSYTVPAHTGLISDLRYGRSTGEVMVTSSFEGGSRVWRTRDYSLLSTLSVDEGKVSSCDLAPDERRVVSVGFDRTVKVYAHEDEF